MPIQYIHSFSKHQTFKIILIRNYDYDKDSLKDKNEFKVTSFKFISGKEILIHGEEQALHRCKATWMTGKYRRSCLKKGVRDRS